MVEGDAETPRVLPRYARLLGASRGRAHREASEAARACLEAMRFRFPDALYLVELVIRLGQVGTFDLVGSVKQIAERSGELLGEPAPDAAKLQRAMRAVGGKTCLVERQSRQLWKLCLAGLCDPTSPQHRRLLAETPSPYRLGAVKPQAGRTVAVEAEAAAARLRETEVECEALRAERSELERQLQTAGHDLVGLRAELDVLRQQREQADEAQRSQEAAFAHERGELERQLRKQEVTVASLNDQLSARDEELRAERERLRSAEAARTPSQADERRVLEDLLLDREIALEEAGRQLAVLRAERENAEAAAAKRLRVAETTAAEHEARCTGLRALLKDERERRRETEARLRRIQVALRLKLAGEADPEVDLEREGMCLDEVRRAMDEHLSAQRSEREQLGRGDDPDPERLGELDGDIRLSRMLGRLLAEAVLEDFPD